MMDKIVGVIGGLGPKATLDFYSKVVNQTHANRDQDHLQVIINSNPKIPNRHSSIAGTGPSCIPSLIDSARSLERAGADFLVMVCNTAHAYEDVIASATNIPFISIITESVKSCIAKEPRAGRIGLLAADGCLEAGLYQKKFASFGIETVCPTQINQARLMSLIYRIKANETGPELKAQMQEITQSLVDQGAEVILAACTEVPLVLSTAEVTCPLVNSTDALVDAAIAYARRTDWVQPMPAQEVSKNIFAPRKRDNARWDSVNTGFVASRVTA